MFKLNESSFLAYQHFQARVNHEANLYGTLDGSIIVTESELNKMTESERSGLLPFHINYFSFCTLFSKLDGRKNLTIVETGTSANAVDSTTLWDTYIQKYGGKLTTIDINPIPKLLNQHRWCINTESIVSDSVDYLCKWDPNNKIDVVYLDSWDVDWFHPKDCQIHGLKEFKSIIPCLSSQAWILIDDTPVSPEWLPFHNETYQHLYQQSLQNIKMPGKGAYVLQIIQNDLRFRVVLHQYQLLIEYNINGFN